MLTIKSLAADAAALPTIIFDEIDTGVSGEIADKMGEIMAGMAHYMQVVAITHLPQVASRGEYHYRIYKTMRVRRHRRASSRSTIPVVQRRSPAC